MTWDEMCKFDDRLTALLQEAGAYRVLFEDGRPGRTFSAERAAKLRKDPNFCRIRLWKGQPQERGDVGLLHQLLQCVGVNAMVLELRTQECVDIATAKMQWAMPGCAHTLDESCPVNFPIPELEPALAAAVAGGTREVLKRPPAQTGFGSLTDRLRHKVKEMEAEEKGTPPPAPLEMVDTNVPDDKAEPVFIVRSIEDARALALDLRIRERFEAGELTKWYARNCIYICDKKSRKELLSLKLTKSSVTGALRWKPVVLTYKDAELERKLAIVCTQVVTVPGTKKPGDDYTTIELEDVRAAVKEIASGELQGTPDMSPEVLDGWLGEICRTYMADLPLAYAWVALLTAASVKLPNLGKVRANLFSGAIGPMGSGKTSAYELAFWLMEVKEPKLLKLKSGSSEGMAERIGDVQAETRLVFVNELAHLLAKVNYEGSTFEQFLNDAFYDDFQELTVARRKQVIFNCRLTLCGGIPEDRFQDLFGVGTAGGFHNRACFAVCPTVFKPYPWRPLDEESPLHTALVGPAEDDPDYLTVETRPQTIAVEVAVWKEKSRWESELGLSARSAELGIRAAIIAACFDRRGTLKMSDLGPALAFAKYQDDAHKNFEPNPGKTNEGIVAHKALTYLRKFAPDGEKWLNRRDLFNAIHAYEFGASVATRALQALEAAGEIEQTKNGRQWLVRLNPNRMGEK